MICLCSHDESYHFNLYIQRTLISLPEYAWVCGKCHGDHGNWIHEFKLDNLSYIEMLAKEKNLI